MASENKKKGYGAIATGNEKKEKKLSLHIENLKKILFEVQNQDTR